MLRCTLCKYVQNKKTKTKKTVTCFPREVYFMGLNSAPLSLSLFPSLRSLRKEKGGGNVGRLPVNQLVGSRP